MSENQPEIQQEKPEPAESKGWFSKITSSIKDTISSGKEAIANRFTNPLKGGLKATKAQIGGKLTGLFKKQKVDDDFLEELEAILLQADCGVEATMSLVDGLQQKVQDEKLDTPKAWSDALQALFTQLIAPLNPPALDTTQHKPFVILLCGVNGAGKTTTIGKLTKLFQQEGKSVLLAAGDTFRAAAIDQLKVWGERNNVPVIAQKDGDPAAVMFDAVAAAKARDIDVVIADTAGRLPTQRHLMQELAKIKRVLTKADPTGPHATWLVLDGAIGQNSVSQAVLFDEAIGLTGLVVTKLDGSAKGGTIAAIAKTHPIPLYYLGVGEQVDDLQPFDASAFASALFERDDLNNEDAKEDE